jgi:hypothetical protein
MKELLDDLVSDVEEIISGIQEGLEALKSYQVHLTQLKRKEGPISEREESVKKIRFSEKEREETPIKKGKTKEEWIEEKKRQGLWIDYSKKREAVVDDLKEAFSDEEVLEEGEDEEDEEKPVRRGQKKFSQDEIEYEEDESDKKKSYGYSNAKPVEKNVYKKMDFISKKQLVIPEQDTPSKQKIPRQEIPRQETEQDQQESQEKPLIVKNKVYQEEDKGGMKMIMFNQ